MPWTAPGITRKQAAPTLLTADTKDTQAFPYKEDKMHLKTTIVSANLRRAGT